MNPEQSAVARYRQQVLQKKYPTRPKAEIKAQGVFPLRAVRTALQKGYLKARGY